MYVRDRRPPPPIAGPRRSSWLLLTAEQPAVLDAQLATLAHPLCPQLGAALTSELLHSPTQLSLQIIVRVQ
jgi:hypothetical protein